MILLWLVMIASCSGSDEIPLDRAEQSSTFMPAHNATDNDLSTYSSTYNEDPAWLRVYFSSSSRVERVVVERGYSWDAACVYTVSVYNGEVQTVCGTYASQDG